jgi:hypothetical protein
MPLHSKTQYPKIWNKYSQKRNYVASVPISTFKCLWAIMFSYHRSAYSAAGIYVDRSWEYINRSQTHECGNWDWHAAQFIFWEYINGIIVAVYVGGGGLEPSKRTEKALAPTIKIQKIFLLSFLTISILLSSQSYTPPFYHWPTSPSCYSIWLNYDWRSLASSLTICQ